MSYQQGGGYDAHHMNDLSRPGDHVCNPPDPQSLIPANPPSPTLPTKAILYYTLIRRAQER